MEAERDREREKERNERRESKYSNHESQVNAITTEDSNISLSTCTQRIEGIKESSNILFSDMEAAKREKKKVGSQNIPIINLE